MANVQGTSKRVILCSMDEPMEGVQEMTAEQFAAEAMAADMAQWIVFNASEVNAQVLTEQLEQWLSDNPPSKTYRYKFSYKSVGMSLSFDS